MTEFISPKSTTTAEDGSWLPIVGSETLELMDHFKETKHFDDASCAVLRDEGLRILSKCVSKQNPKHHDTGLVFGYIQSGKTASYTTLIALAKDNGIQIVILIAGTTTNLLKQSTDRLPTDLRLNTRSDRTWKHITNPEGRDTNGIRGTVDLWKDERLPPSSKKTILITVLKQTDRLEKLTNVLKSIDLKDVPVLVIDDECDQASLNTKARRNAKLNEQGASAIYARIMELRKALPYHTYLQYTATPQANLFINILDRLSPEFIELLTPGKGYVGVKQFFEEHSELIKDIPAGDIYKEGEEHKAPPESLMESLRMFFLCVTLGELNYIQSRNISMMVHPSQKTTKHNIYFRWVERIKDRWVRIFDARGQTPEKKELMREFKATYKDLQSTAKEIPPFDKLPVAHLIQALRETEVHELNSKTKITTVNWANSFANILVGGQVMDRGFTVEGLMITYMPRSVGVGYVDTIQQRARFFGYKQKYLNFCRIYLGAETRAAYESYIIHEENMRSRLADFADTGESLSTWQRRVRLEMHYKLTRPNVLSGEQKRYHFSASWFTIKSPHDSQEIIQDNRIIVHDFFKGKKLRDDPGHEDRTTLEIHKTVTLPLKEVFENLLVQLRYTRESDSHNFTEVRYFIKAYLDNNPGAECVVYLMSDDVKRERALNRKDEIDGLFQGPNPKGRNPIYPGDKKIRVDDKVCVQVHHLDLKDKTGKGAKVIFGDLYSIAIWLPDSIGPDEVGVE